ncbi:phosphonate ABC transporter, permease protein PhnE [Cohnella zeiphila]|uniref:Phosphonate ABC transporter, permease protein PhnE n=1 Tax=Cohnella zeiphila TaxID=2761120 RepID=A0A7X0VYJ8_9BACL|nr:phosphonate ABC transporter, permease protein PhnE [Cohnella zeiphila]MBB6735096.1 phosphonate ABC transporter, permease protein PhnE [Cohnella zeiphila]
MEAQWLRIRRQKRVQTVTIVVLIAALVVWSAVQTKFHVLTVFGGLGEMGKLIVNDFLPPHPEALKGLIEPALDTIYMSVVGMVVGSLISAVLAFFAAATTTPHRIVLVLVRGFASVLRNIPGLIWALMLAFAYGIGTLVGTLAIIIYSVGSLVRAYAEILEEIDQSQLEAVKATGATFPQVLGQAVLPQFIPGFVAWSLYKLELNIRASTIVGMVGGGGLGFYIQNGLKLFHFRDVSMAIILMLVLIVVTEFFTNKIREKVI